MHRLAIDDGERSSWSPALAVGYGVTDATVMIYVSVHIVGLIIDDGMYLIDYRIHFFTFTFLCVRT